MVFHCAAVLIDVDTLNTLPDRELASGISEIIKYGLIRDPDLFVWLEANMERLLQRDPEARCLTVLFGGFWLACHRSKYFPEHVQRPAYVAANCVQQLVDAPVAAFWPASSINLCSFGLCQAT